MTQEELSKKSGIAPATISSWVGKSSNSKRAVPSIENLISVANALGVTVGYLIGEKDCLNIDNEAIHKKIGISEAAIMGLKSFQKNSKLEINGSENIIKENLKEDLKEIVNKKMDVINLLLEKFLTTPLFEDMYDFIYFNNYEKEILYKHDENGNYKPISSTPRRREEIILGRIQYDLANIREVNKTRVKN